VRLDDSAVAGFFEDIPVLIIILTGVSSLVLSGVMASERITAVTVQRGLDELAERLVCWIAIWVHPDQGIEHASLASFMSVNITRGASEVLDDESYKVAVVQRLPRLEWIRSASNSEAADLLNTGYASGLFNARLGDGTIGVVEVAAFVWR